MGNHAIGRAMVAIAEVAAERRKPDETALDILDMAAERSEVRGMDAEFDDACMPDTPFGQLLMEAFHPEYDADADDDYEQWFELVEQPFSQRYELC